METLQADLTQCVRCGLCLQHCPTYIETGLETESPRGRLYLMKALEDGIIDATPTVTGHLDQCLQCRNCEAVCPSGVPFGHEMETARSQVLEGSRAPLSWRVRATFLRAVVARPERLGMLASALAFTEATGLRDIAERLPSVGRQALLSPRFHRARFPRRGLLAVPYGRAKARVGLLTGCIMPFAFGRVHGATVRVLARNGCVVSAPRAQVCCGALHAHNGDMHAARDLARRNIDAFEGTDTIIVNSAGCGAAMKEYVTLLADDDVYKERAADLSGRVRDISEFLVALPYKRPKGRIDATVTYQDSCHLAHAQRVTAAPRRVLESIPGLRLVEMKLPDRCCGSAGVYSLTQPAMSLSLLRRKMSDVTSSGAAFVATSNPGCMTQLEAGVRMSNLRVRVVHVVELLDQSYRAA